MTLAEARTLLSRYTGAGNDFVERINLVSERLIRKGNWTGTKQRVAFQVYPDALNRAFITLPRTLNTILAGGYFSHTEAGLLCGGPNMPVRNGWYEFTSSGAGLQLQSSFCGQRGFLPMDGRFTTFVDWSDPRYLRLKFETQEHPGATFHIRGTFGDSTIYTLHGENRIEGENLVYVNDALTTTELYDEAPYAFHKPVTNGRVTLYTVDENGVEQLVDIFEPAETAPRRRRYLIPACPNWDAYNPGYFLAICKRAYAPVAVEMDELFPANTGALRFGLEALQKEDSEDYARAAQLWDLAKQELLDEVTDENGAGEQSHLDVEDEYDMASIGTCYGLY